MMENVLGYIDPASGSILLQIVVGAVVGAALFFRQGIGRVLTLLRRR